MQTRQTVLVIHTDMICPVLIFLMQFMFSWSFWYFVTFGTQIVFLNNCAQYCMEEHELDTGCSDEVMDRYRQPPGAHKSTLQSNNQPSEYEEVCKIFNCIFFC